MIQIYLYSVTLKFSVMFKVKWIGIIENIFKEGMDTLLFGLSTRETQNRERLCLYGVKFAFKLQIYAYHERLV